MIGYHASIAKAIGTDDEKEAAVVEQVMRTDRPTLDALDRASFDRLARESAETLAWLRRHDPEVASMYVDQAGGVRS